MNLNNYLMEVVKLFIYFYNILCCGNSILKFIFYSEKIRTSLLIFFYQNMMSILHYSQHIYHIVTAYYLQYIFSFLIPCQINKI